MAVQAAQARKEATREAILDAALERFSRYGYRRTSMDDIAQEAGISRAAIYLYFKNKEEIFRAVALGLHDQHLHAAEQAASDDGSIEERVHGFLEAKFGGFLEIAYGSPHGAELLDENSRICGDISLAARRRSVRLLKALIEQAAAAGELAPERAGLTPGAAAELIYDCARGMERDVGSSSQSAYRRRLGQITRVMVAGLGGKS